MAPRSATRRPTSSVVLVVKMFTLFNRLSELWLGVSYIRLQPPPSNQYRRLSRTSSSRGRVARPPTDLRGLWVQSCNHGRREIKFVKLVYRYVHDLLNVNLLNVYKGLIVILGIPPKTIHNWRVRGVLVDQIKATYFRVPEDSRGECFSWFLQNEHIVERAGQPLSAQTSPNCDNAALVDAWRFTGGNVKDSVEDIKTAIARKPEDEQKCHWMYAFLFSKGFLPPPELDIWVDFGFASCKSQQEELELGTRYRQLITTCVFKEFCDAFRAHALLALFRFKGVEVNDHRHLWELLGGNWKKSVWYLKQSVRQANSPMEKSNMHPAVMVDYGFINCENDIE